LYKKKHLFLDARIIVAARRRHKLGLSLCSLCHRPASARQAPQPASCAQMDCEQRSPSHVKLCRISKAVSCTACRPLAALSTMAMSTASSMVLRLAGTARICAYLRRPNRRRRCERRCCLPDIHTALGMAAGISPETP